ncbi:MAG: hypothetical protein WC123_04210 [Bacilli bacterium]
MNEENIFKDIGEVILEELNSDLINKKLKCIDFYQDKANNMLPESLKGKTISKIGIIESTKELIIGWVKCN